MIRGTPKFDGMAVGEITVVFTGLQLQFEAKAAFIDSKTGETHGWTKATAASWSPTTIDKLRELRALMELDLGKLHLEGGGEILVGPPGAVPQTGVAFEGGLSEHLGKQV
jgi:hypothetical protein